LTNFSLFLLDSLRCNALSLCLGTGDAGCSGAHLACFGVNTCFGDSSPSTFAGLPDNFELCMQPEREALAHDDRAQAHRGLHMPPRHSI
jgi:hypothetical protein